MINFFFKNTSIKTSRKKNSRKKIGFIFFAFLMLTGCGEGTVEERADRGKTENNAVSSFEVGSYEVNLKTPKNWKNLPPKPSSGILWRMESGNSNFIMMQRQGYHEGIEKQLLETVMQDFFFFRLEDKTGLENGWVYTARPQSNKVERVFYQKIIPLDSTEFLLGSCSFESQGKILTEDFVEKTNCLNIMNDWQVRSLKNL